MVRAKGFDYGTGFESDEREFLCKTGSRRFLELCNGIGGLWYRI